MAPPIGAPQPQYKFPNLSLCNGTFRMLRRPVIYLTLSMRPGVRVLSMFLSVWLAAGAAFSGCCWSMAYAHDHPAPAGAASQSLSSEHHHHEASESSAPLLTGSTVRGRTRHCDIESGDAAIATAAGLSRVGALTAVATTFFSAVPPFREPMAAPSSDFAPLGSPPSSAFLNPLRV
jgi:hypothetical protein